VRNGGASRRVAWAIMEARIALAPETATRKAGGSGG